VPLNSEGFCTSMSLHQPPPTVALAPPGSVASAAPKIHLLGGFHVSAYHDDLSLPFSTWRLVAFLALSRRPLNRSYVASCLWLDKREDRAQANLRSTLWRIRQIDEGLVAARGTNLMLGRDVRVDVDEATALAHALIDDQRDVDLDAIDLESLSADLLPDWYDEFVESERERLRQLRLHALECLSHRLRARGCTARALDVALLLIASDPLRESAHRAVIEVHLAEGNVHEAVRHYDLLTSQLDTELGIAPSAETRHLIERPVAT
jgi:DNA-binding SARP family transcriptional activator